VEDPNAILDLTKLLATGRASDGVTDYLGSGEQMTERVCSSLLLILWGPLFIAMLQGLQKWESTVVEALLKLRDYSSRRVAPACQRVHILLQEVQGWAQL
jgi:anaphase-promoting complex subunit 4